jgi:hypothetical protein
MGKRLHKFRTESDLHWNSVFMKALDSNTD